MTSSPSAFSTAFSDMACSSPLPRFSDNPKTPSFRQKMENEGVFVTDRKPKPLRTIRMISIVVITAVVCTFSLVLLMTPTKKQFDRVPYKHNANLE